MAENISSSELVKQVSTLGQQLSELAQKLRRHYSNYLPMDPASEEAFTALSKGLTDMNHVLETNCHGLTPAAAEYEAKVLGQVRIPVVSKEELGARVDFRRLSWDEAKPVLPSAPRYYTGTEKGGITPISASVRYFVREDSTTGKPILSPEGQPLIAGYKLEFRHGDRVFLTHTNEKGLFDLPLLGLTHASLSWASDNELAPAIQKGNILLIDQDIRHYDGDGTYCFEKGASHKHDIAELKFLPTGGFSYISNREYPQHIIDTSSLKFLGKVVLIMQRTDEPWPKAR